MSDVVIRAEGLGKKYLIGHQAEQEAHPTFRDLIARSTKNLVRSSADMIKGRQLIAGDEIEEFWALKDVNFEIKRGEVVGIIGRNGAGKSTLLKILSRITEPSVGRAEIKGRVASLLEVGTGFHPELTGRENVFLNGAILGMSRAEIKRKFDEIVDFAGVEKFLDTPVKRYSSGMYVRLAFAVAAHLDPEILVIDEVLAVGDAEFQKKCLGKMKDVAGDGRTVLFVSHSMSAMRTLCPSAVLLQNGHVAFRGPTAQAIDKYLSSSTINTAKLKWDYAAAPGTENVKLLSFSAHQNETTDIFRSGDEICLSMGLLIKNTIPQDICIGFEIVTQEQTSLLWSYHTDGGVEDWPQLRIGINILVCALPRNLLNGGKYNIFPRISIHRKEWIVNIDNGVSIDVVLSHGKSPYWTQLSTSDRRLGMIAPILSWTSHDAAEKSKSNGESTPNA